MAGQIHLGRSRRIGKPYWAGSQADYPNVDGAFTIEISGNETYNVAVANMQGQVVKRETGIFIK